MNFFDQIQSLAHSKPVLFFGALVVLIYAVVFIYENYLKGD